MGEVRRDGHTIALGARQQRAVLAMLVLHAGELVSSERLIDDFWGERPPATAAKPLQVDISRLGKALTPKVASGSADVIVTREHGYVLEVGREQIDVQVFAGLLDEGRRAHAEGGLSASGPRVDGGARASRIFRG